MTSKKVLVLSVITFMLMMGIAYAESRYSGAFRMGCPDNYFDPERGCQIPYDLEYVPVREEPVESMKTVECPDEYYNHELGCQIHYGVEYIKDKVPVSEEDIRKNIYMGCPEELFKQVLGCQIPVWKL